MERKVLELAAPEDVLAVYDVYRHCMFQPTPEKFRKKAEGFLADATVRIFACLEDGEVRGVAVLSLAAPHRGELLGIATAPEYRGRGIGSGMIAHLTARCGLTALLAETDDDAVGFYRKTGFAVTPCTAIYDGQPVTRYRCERVK